MEKKIIVEVIGTIIAVGTGALFDELSNVWLYNPADTIDLCLPGFDQKAGIVLPKGEKGSFERLIMVDEVFDADVSVVHDDSEEEMEINFEKLYLDSI